jgi:hypothetical protein
LTNRRGGYQYKCSNGHVIYCPHELEECLSYVKGKPCTGTMKRFGRGSREANKQAKAVAPFDVEL